jgi:hypothetical protein
MRFPLLLAILVAWSGAGVAFAWVPVGCSDRIEEIEALRSRPDRGEGDVTERWRRFAESVRTAKPGSPVYAPKPFPKNRAEILANFEHAFRNVLLRNTPLQDLPEGVEEIYRALETDRLDVDILRVENWSTSRCGLNRLKPFSYLLRLHDRNSRRELGRFAIHDTGLWGGFQAFPAAPVRHWSQTLLPLDGLEGFLSRQFGFRQKIGQTQYVAPAGPQECSALTPCVAFRSQGKLYLVTPRLLLYELGTDLTSVSELASRTARRLPVLAPEYETPMVSVGYAWVQARRVAGKSPAQE